MKLDAGLQKSRRRMKEKQTKVARTAKDLEPSVFLIDWNAVCVFRLPVLMSTLGSVFLWFR